ncbi:MAG TPA: hypothetical protein VMF11_04180 [Candidatus Baltobacteraceae bacterium]|nr:hypothetical protein [Candidatus Baltobacteraceae bacterium]
MKRFRFTSLLVAALFVVCANAIAAEPPNYTYSPRPPGTIVQSKVVYLGGEAMHSQWRAVLSKKPVGTNGKESFYQWYLSIYAIDATVYRLKYQSPKNPVPFRAVEKAHGANLWFPVADGSIAGAGELMGPGAQQVVIVSHQMAADCGMARVDVFFAGAAMNAVMPTLSIENPCDLSAKIVKDAQGTALAVTGPYYGPDAPMCCPTKPKATAIFRMTSKGWTQTPRYFKVTPTP